MIDRQGDFITLYCDTCDEELGEEFDAHDEFQAMIDYAKSQGWKIQQDAGGTWHHYCEPCASMVIRPDSMEDA